MSWDKKLSEPIALERGEHRFQTLRDAAAFLASRYSTAKGGVLGGALSDLMAAAENPTPAAIERATDQFAAFLIQQGLIKSRASRHPASEDLPQRIAAMLAGKRRPRSLKTARRRGAP